METARGHSVIVGGAGGLGRSVVEAFLRAGATVTVIDRQPPPAQAPGSPAWVAADVRDAAQRARAVEAVAAQGPISALVFLQRFRGEGDAWAGELTTTLSATREMLERLADSLAAAGGAVVMVGSAAGHFVAGEQPASYHVAKAGLAQLARWFAVELGPRGVRCNLVSPAVFVRPATRAADEARYAPHAGVTPLRRVPTTEEIARVILFLAGPGAACITGQEIAVDAGLSLLAHASLVSALAARRDARG